ncbi:hypothetical protein ACFOST_16480 [Cytobacillus kochii]|uniref:hypothetical protein n=1 Tax=Cytobacillus kochii TaxID=859143 RepID=UPI002785DDB0|nr:hypothetical protein [Cytobacillus kochii]MDQ0185280.1 uridine kinase [Cytobacillus kochii]
MESQTFIKEKDSFIIAIAAVSGGGKTEITKALGNQLPHAVALHFDEFELAGPSSIIQWIENGANPQAWDITPIVKELQRFKQNYAYIILDFPFSYLHQAIASEIDLSFFIDTPLDIALARRILRDFEHVKDINDDLRYYMKKGRGAYIHMLETVRMDADKVIDGTLSKEETTQQKIEEVNRRIKDESDSNR